MPGESTNEPAGRSGATESDPALSHDTAPKPKRIACCLCRKRKLKCDGSKPICGTCARLGHECKYEEVRRKSGPKRGYVKALEARLAQVETLLKTQDAHDPNPNPPVPESYMTSDEPVVPPNQPTFISTDEGVNFAIGNREESPIRDFNQMSTQYAPVTMDDNEIQNIMDFDIGLGTGDMPFELISLGLEEPLPAQELIDELETIYFQKVHPSLPMVQETRYRASCRSAPSLRPAIHLRYAMWCLAATISPPHVRLADTLYQRSRKYVERAEMSNVGEAMIGVQTCQCWSLVASYEFKHMYFPRAWMSTGRASRMAQMMGLYRLDGGGIDVKQCIPPPRDWLETEERRRTFWTAFCQDRYASVGTGWPMVLDEKDFTTLLPSSEKAFDLNLPEETLSLRDSMTPSGISKLTPYGGLVLMACLFGRNLIHLHRPDEDNKDGDLNGAFWRRHRHMDGILLNTSLSLPQRLRLPNGIGDANVVFVNMNIHTATICLHQAAIFKSDKHRLSGTISAESKIRCITAAAEIATIMRTISHMDLSMMNPFMAFCLYVSARVFVQYLKSRPQDENARSSLQFLLLAMQQLKASNPLVESFLVQLDVDLESVGLSGFHSMISPESLPPYNCAKPHPGGDECTALLGIQETRNPAVGSDPSLSTAHKGLGSLPIDLTQDQGAPQRFSADNQMNLPNRMKTFQKSPASREGSYGQSPISPADDAQTRTNLSKWKSSDPAEFSKDGFARVPDMHFSPDTTGSTSASANSGHPTPDTMASNQTSSRNSFTPPSYEAMPVENAHTGGASAAGGAEGIWNPAYDFDVADVQFSNPFKAPDPAAFNLPADWDMQAGMNLDSNFANFADGVGGNTTWEGTYMSAPYQNTQQQQRHQHQPQ